MYFQITRMRCFRNEFKQFISKASLKQFEEQQKFLQQLVIRKAFEYKYLMRLKHFTLLMINSILSYLIFIFQKKKYFS
jgi:hypothetical protein